MKHLTFLLVLISCFSIKSNAQRGPAATNEASMQSSSRDVSNYNNNSISNSYSSPNNYAARSEATYSAASYRNSPPAASSSNNMNIPNTNTGASAASSVAYGNGSSPANTHSTVHNTQPIMRYNYTIKGSYPYYPSPNRKRKDNREDNHLARVNRENNSRQLLPYTSFNDFCDIPVAIGSQTSYYAGFPDPSVAINISLDGYVVYGADTLSGIVTITPAAVLLEQSINANSEAGYTFAYNNNTMKSVVVFKGDDELYLTRTSANDSALLRVLHEGKLNVYDDVYAFPTVENVDQRNVQFDYGNKIRSINSLVVLDWRTPLMRAINKAYGIKLHTLDMSWNNLLLYMNKLD